jgi:MGT family glycosyltransferase
MSTAVVLSYPTHGHITPAMGVVSELVKRGENVIFYATNRSRAKIQNSGAEFRAYGRDHDHFSPTPPTDGLFSDMARLIALTEDMLPDLLDRVANDAPDYVLVDTKSLWGRLTAQILGIPAITMSVVFAIQPKLVPVPALVNGLYGGSSNDRLFTGLEGLGRYFEAARRMTQRYGTRSPGIVGYLGNPHPLNIIFTSREFQLEGDRFGEDYKFVGPCIAADRDAAHDFPFEQLNGAPLLYISLGTTFNDAPEFYRSCFEAFADAPWQIVLSAGAGDFACLQAAPENFIVRRYVPQLELLRRADAFVTHGGMNSANEGLYHSVPLIVVPQRGDQHLVAARVSALGAGVSIQPAAVTPQKLREAATNILCTPEYRERAAKIGDSLLRAGGHARAAEEIIFHKRNLCGQFLREG